MAADVIGDLIKIFQPKSKRRPSFGLQTAGWKVYEGPEAKTVEAGRTGSRIWRPAVRDTQLPEERHGFQYDLVVIGGGCGGLACAREAAKFGKKVAVLDYVYPSPAGTVWGLGGTSVNVGCIPKMLMHHAAVVGEAIVDAQEAGWNVRVDGHDWNKLVMMVQDYINSLNLGYKIALRDAKIDYIHAYGRFVDAHTVECKDRRAGVRAITSRRFVIAVGGRPRYMGVDGDKEFCITSDDLFAWDKPPGKTLCVGGSFVALEIAGFLTSLGFGVTVFARSVFLRGFDQQAAEHVVSYMEHQGTKMIANSVPIKFERDEKGKVLVTYSERKSDVFRKEVFDTVIIAVGRDALTLDLRLDKAGVEFNQSTGKIRAVHEQTNVKHIYAVGDVLEGKQELAAVAIKTGTLLAKRLFGGGKEFTDYCEVPATVYTPLEYGCIGMAEDAAEQQYGAENIEVYVSYLKPMLWNLNKKMRPNGTYLREDHACFLKLVTLIPEKERIIGLHIVAPNAGEIVGGYAVALKLGARKEDFDASVGVHPSISEEFTLMKVTKRSGGNPYKPACV
ncbi:hypothetical protein CBR_g40754 [Chara braunii]|uniref:thioredoxin-disulfide reductase (NADPH) n=1 Tax=Chara braunii TaxID=69332 RepID=A0A388LUK7_CHABU|nr:hypothetical protein CBR_g40754 [Chara braunii]|eukprot:GBG85941.1 hypothetical protein CBR_g40754 [Chara braunii]